MTDTKRGRELEKAATPGEWSVYVEKTPLPSDVYRELEEQARHNVTDKSFTGELVMLSDGARAPAITGCGPTSRANADLIVWLRNNAQALLDAAERAEAGELPSTLGLEARLGEAIFDRGKYIRKYNEVTEKLTTAERRVAELEKKAAAFDTIALHYSLGHDAKRGEVVSLAIGAADARDTAIAARSEAECARDEAVRRAEAAESALRLYAYELVRIGERGAMSPSGWRDQIWPLATRMLATLGETYSSATAATLDPKGVK